MRLRQRVTKGPGSRAAGVAMAFKLIESAQTRWRAVNAPHLVALVRAGATFTNGKLVERSDEPGGDQLGTTDQSRLLHATAPLISASLVRERTSAVGQTSATSPV